MCKTFEVSQWMTGTLGLSGNELILFAILWKESKHGEIAVKGSYTELSAAMGATIPTMYKCINKLMERGYIRQPRKGVFAIADNFYDIIKVA